MRSSASPLPHKKKEDIVFYVSKAPPLRALEYSVLLLSLRFFFPSSPSVLSLSLSRHGEFLRRYKSTYIG
jgi:hypothetical protein